MHRVIIAVVAAGVVGTVANAIAAGFFIGTDKFGLVLVPGRYLVAILCAAVLPLSLGILKLPISNVSGIVVLILVPSFLAKFVFGAAASWSVVISLNAVYAIAAWVTYLFLVRRVWIANRMGAHAE